MTIEGSELDGVVRAIDFLLNVNHGYRVNLGKRVVVIGGGFVAFDAARWRCGRRSKAKKTARGGSMKAALDAARSAVRAGVTDVSMISLESFDEMPVMRTAQGREEFEEARNGRRALSSRSAGRDVLSGKDGEAALDRPDRRKRTYDENGRFNPVYDNRVSETLEADTVILAIGQQADLSLPDARGWRGIDPAAHGQGGSARRWPLPRRESSRVAMWRSGRAT